MPVLPDSLRELATMVPVEWSVLCRDAANKLDLLIGAKIGKFQPIVSLGIDKNGEIDFRVNLGIADFDRDRMDELCRMMPWAIKEALTLWLQHGPPSKENAQSTNSNDKPPIMPFIDERMTDCGQ